MELKDYYYILGIRRNASIDEIKHAYRKLSTKFHPDKNDGDKFFEERFKDIQEAYETLSDSFKRKFYDEKLNTGQSFNSEKTYSNTDRSSTEPTVQSASRKRKERLYAILGGVILIAAIAKIILNIVKTKETVDTYHNILNVLHDTTSYDTNKITRNTTDDSVVLLRMYYDTPVSPPPATTVTDRDPINPNPPGGRNNDQLRLKDDDGLTAEEAVSNFFHAFNNNDCHGAWSLTYHSYWLSKGENWFCSSEAFGGVRKISVNNIYTSSQSDTYAEIYTSYYAEDAYNGNKCFKQTITVQKIAYTDNRSRWRITKMRNNEPPVGCTGSQ